MTTWRAMTSLWEWQPSVLLGCAVLLLGYVALTRHRPSVRAAWFVAGLVLLIVALCSPLDTLGDTYLFSAHMLQHMLLVLAVPPLLILGLPAWLVAAWLRMPAVAGAERRLRQPAIAWLVGIGTLYLWHAPPLYNATLTGPALHIGEHLSFLITGTIFWWPVCAPRVASRLSHLAAGLYLFAAAVASSVLGIMLTFTAPGLYPAYLHPVDRHGALSLIRDHWGLSPAVDQQLGGLCMWVLGGLVYLGAILITLAHWYLEEDDRALSPAESPARDRGLPVAGAIDRGDLIAVTPPASLPSRGTRAHVHLSEQLPRGKGVR
jgi:putative membrane protein